MASIGHVAVAAALSRTPPKAQTRARRFAFFVFLAVLSMLPDADVIGFARGVPYGAEWGHRGASHSLVFALAIAVLCFPLHRFSTLPRRRFFLVCLVTIASHGLLDAMTTGGLGVALLWPFSNARYFFPWRPIPVAPIGLGMLSSRGLHVLVKETLLFLPFWLAAIFL